MKNTKATNETATQAYTRNLTAVYAKLEKIKAHLLETSIDCREAHWGNVGSATHLNELLDEICEFENIK